MAAGQMIFYDVISVLFNAVKMWLGLFGSAAGLATRLWTAAANKEGSAVRR